MLGIVEVMALLTVGANFRAAVAFGMLFVVLVGRPQGLLGSRVRERI